MPLKSYTHIYVQRQKKWNGDEMTTYMVEGAKIKSHKIKVQKILKLGYV